MPTPSNPRAALAPLVRDTAICLSILLAPAGAIAQLCDGLCSDPAKACICVIAPPEAKFGLTRLGTVEPENGRLGQALGVGDQLSNLGADTIVELACPGGSEVKLHGPFHAVVLPSGEGQDCAFNLLAGNADVLARMPTTLDAGEAVMGSITTQYGMRVFRKGDEPGFECIVFEGEAEVKYRAGNIRLGENNFASWSAGIPWRAVEVAPITPAEINATSLVYARADVARLAARGEQPADQRALVAELSSAYANVLTRPRDADARIQMAALQTNLSNSRQVLYHLEQAEQLEPARPEQQAEISALRSTAHARLARPEPINVGPEVIREDAPAPVVEPEAIPETPPTRVEPNRFRDLGEAVPPPPVDPRAVPPQ